MGIILEFFIAIFLFQIWLSYSPQMGKETDFATIKTNKNLTSVEQIVSRDIELKHLKILWVWQPSLCIPFLSSLVIIVLFLKN